jgi:hypothetical protein
MELLFARIVCAFIFLVVQIVNFVIVGLMVLAAIFIPYGILRLYLG